MSQTKEPKDSTAKDSKDAKGSGKPRVYALAQELNLESKDIIDICKELGYSAITSQLKALEADQVDAIKNRVKHGANKPAAPIPASTIPAKPATLPVKVENKIPTIAKPKVVAKTPTVKPVEVEQPTPEPEVVAEVPSVPEVVVVAEVPVVPPPPAPLPKPPAKLPNIGKPQSLNTPRPKPKVVEPAPAPAPAVTVPEPEVVPTPVAEVPTVVETPVVAVKQPEPEVEVPAPQAEITPVNEVAVEVEAKPEVELPKVPANRPAVLLPPRSPNMPQRPQGLPQQGSTMGRPGGMPPNMPQRPQGAPPQQGGRPQAVPSGRTPPNPGPPRPAAFGPSGPIAPPSGRTPPNPGPPQRPAAFGPSGPTAPQQRPGGPNNQGGNQGGPGGNRPNTGPSPAPANAPGSKSVKLTLEQIQRLRQLEQQKGRQKIDDVVRQVTAPQPEAPRPGDAPPGPAKPGFTRDAGPNKFKDEGEGGGDDRRRGPGGPTTGGPNAGGAAAGRDQRHKQRAERGRGTGTGAARPGSYRNQVVIGAGGSVDIIEQSSGSRIKKHRGRQHVKPSNKVLTGKIDIAVPITVRNLSETIGMKAGEVILKLKNLTNSLYTINSNIEFDTAELIAIEKGIELVAKKQETAEDEVLRKLRESTEASDPANLVLRSPVVTIMGHVDHGKTSLLDRIRAEYGLESDVVSTEAGGITQVLRAWRVQKDGLSTTFLDTPGHEAFTKMRARGANVTDIAVIVVSATDGIMPQTQEAVAHAKAADVDIIVAINKCDLPGANPEKVKNRLYDMELVPEDMGGDVPVIFTSAMTGQGIGELLDSIALLAEVAELKADPSIAGSGTCLEAYKQDDRGVVATFLVQNGTVRKGDTILCGSTFGRVRAMYDDLAQPIDEAGPSTPVKIIGLNDVPDADDPFYVVDDIGTAREIAENRKDVRSEFDRIKFSPVSLDKLKEQSGKAKITELKVILKAEARGSVEAIKKELEKLLHDEVRVRVLHAGIGAINESDVTLGLTSPDDTIILGFNVTSDDAAMKLAEARGINIREYQIIYNLVDDVKAALEGRLKPIEEIVHLGRAVVRDTFKITKVGTIAGCYVTSGTIERNARVRVIRDGVVIFPQGEKVVGLDSLKRHKDDAKEVREGFECGAKITGFDDIKTGDVIEAYKIEIKQRTL